MYVDPFTITMWLGTLIFLIISFKKNEEKTIKVLKTALNMRKGMVLSIFSIIFTIGLILTILPPADIAAFIEKQSVLLATVVSAILGTITLVPPFIAFPLVGTLKDTGVRVIPSVIFLKP